MLQSHPEALLIAVAAKFPRDGATLGLGGNAAIYPLAGPETISMWLGFGSVPLGDVTLHRLM